MVDHFLHSNQELNIWLIQIPKSVVASDLRGRGNIREGHMRASFMFVFLKEKESEANKVKITGFTNLDDGFVGVILKVSYSGLLSMATLPS